MDHSHHSVDGEVPDHIPEAGHDHGSMSHSAESHVGHQMNLPDITGRMGEDHSHHNPSAHEMHSMVFHGGVDETVLFSFWKFTTAGGLIASIFIIFVMAVLYEGLKYYREFLFWKTYNNLQYQAVQANASNKDATVEEEARIVQPSMLSKAHGWQTFLHAIQVTVSYFLMLIFMTYNTWLCIAVVLGAATGNFLFGWRKHVIVDVTEHCH